MSAKPGDGAPARLSEAHPATANDGFRCKGAGAVAIGIIRTLIREKSENGTIPMTEVERILELVEKGTISLDQAWSAHAAGCLAARETTKPKVGARDNPFGRMLVRPFEWMLFSGALDRKTLPSFFAAAKDMLGPKWDEGEKEAKEIVRALLALRGGALTWDDVYGSAEGIRLLTAYVGAIADALDDDGRARRFRAFLKQKTGEGDVMDALQIDELASSIKIAGAGLRRMT
jgi:hypothetical protein